MLLQFFRFASVGLVATVVHVAIVFFLVEWMDVDPVLSSLPAFFTAVSAAFFLNRNWTFSSTQSKNDQFRRYLIVALGGMLLNLVIMYVTVHIAHGPYFVGISLVVAIVPIVSFVLQRKWTFGRLKQSAE
jgi:putative flippase GtrA